MASIERIPADHCQKRTEGKTKQSEAAQALGTGGNASLLFFLAVIVFTTTGSIRGQEFDSRPSDSVRELLDLDEAKRARDQARDNESVRTLAEPSRDADSELPAPDQNDLEVQEIEDLRTSGGNRAGEAGSGMIEADIEAGLASLDDQPLSIADVIASTYRAYPEINRAREERRRAGGELLSAWGTFDTKLHGHALSEPTGFYENYRNGLGLARQTWWGGYVGAGYRIGRGNFQPWYKERQTDDAGEFKLSFAQPLLRGRAIDPARVAVFQASIATQAAAPLVQEAILLTARDAAYAYWDWVTAGAVLEAQRELLELAEERGRQFEILFKADRAAEIDVILNRQLIAERRAKVIETEQKFRSTAFKLSLYLRNDVGQPVVPRDDWLPKYFPRIVLPDLTSLEQDLVEAISRRPEVQLLQFELRQIQLECRLARNQMLPQLDMIAEVSQDMGEPASSKIDDKGRFELLFGVQGEVPIQRRKARGKLQQASAKAAQIREKLRLAQDKIGAELRNAYNALALSKDVVEQSEIALVAAIDSLTRYRFAFERGKIDLIALNLLETKANEVEIKLVNAQRTWFDALVDLQFTLGLDPLEQAMAVAAIPPSNRPGPGNLPKPQPIADENQDDENQDDENQDDGGDNDEAEGDDAENEA